MQWWKWVGLAGVLGVTASGVAVARAERARSEYTPDDVRARLHERAARAGAAPRIDEPRIDEAGTDPA